MNKRRASDYRLASCFARPASPAAPAGDEVFECPVKVVVDDKSQAETGAGSGIPAGSLTGAGSNARYFYLGFVIDMAMVIIMANGGRTSWKKPIHISPR